MNALTSWIRQRGIPGGNDGTERTSMRYKVFIDTNILVNNGQVIRGVKIENPFI